MIRVNRNPSRRQLRQFAAIWLPLFGAMVGAVLWWRTGDLGGAAIVWSATAVAAASGLASLAAARAIFLALSWITFPIGFVVSWVAVALVYFAVMTPIALVLRATGRDPLRLRRPSQATTYWERREERSSGTRAFQQF